MTAHHNTKFIIVSVWTASLVGDSISYSCNLVNRIVIDALCWWTTTQWRRDTASNRAVRQARAGELHHWL